jgi:hypothetical protein
MDLDATFVQPRPHGSEQLKISGAFDDDRTDVGQFERGRSRAELNR